MLEVRRRLLLARIALLALLGAPGVAAGAEDLFRVRIAPNGEVWAVGSRGVIRKLGPAGEESERTSAVDAWNDVCFGTAEHGVVVGLDGAIAETIDGGATWTAVGGQDARHLFAIGCDGALAIAAGDLGAIRMRDPRGQWEDRSLGDDVVLYGVAVAAGGVSLVVGEGGVILRSESPGGDLRRVASPTDRTLFDVALEPDGLAVAVGIGGTLLRSEDGGRRWNLVRTEIEEALYGVALEGRRGVAVGERSVLLRTEDGGASWTIDPAASRRTIGFLHGAALRGERTIAVGSAGGVLWLP